MRVRTESGLKRSELVSWKVGELGTAWSLFTNPPTCQPTNLPYAFNTIFSQFSSFWLKILYPSAA